MQNKSSDGFKKREEAPKRVHQEIKEYRSGTLSNSTKRRKPTELGRAIDEMFR